MGMQIENLAGTAAAAARAVLRTVLTDEGLTADGADATATSQGDHLTVTLFPGVEIEPGLSDTLSVRALAAVRSVHRSASVIDVLLR